MTDTTNPLRSEPQEQRLPVATKVRESADRQLADENLALFHSNRELTEQLQQAEYNSKLLKGDILMLTGRVNQALQDLAAERTLSAGLRLDLLAANKQPE